MYAELEGVEQSFLKKLLSDIEWSFRITGTGLDEPYRLAISSEHFLYSTFLLDLHFYNTRSYAFLIDSACLALVI